MSSDTCASQKQNRTLIETTAFPPLEQMLSSRTTCQFKMPTLSVTRPSLFINKSATTGFIICTGDVSAFSPFPEHRELAFHCYYFPLAVLLNSGIVSNHQEPCLQIKIRYPLDPGGIVAYVTFGVTVHGPDHKTEELNSTILLGDSGYTWRCSFWKGKKNGGLLEDGLCSVSRSRGWIRGSIHTVRIHSAAPLGVEVYSIVCRYALFQ